MGSRKAFPEGMHSGSFTDTSTTITHSSPTVVALFSSVGVAATAEHILYKRAEPIGMGGVVTVAGVPDIADAATNGTETNRTGDEEWTAANTKLIVGVGVPTVVSILLMVWIVLCACTWESRCKKLDQRREERMSMRAQGIEEQKRPWCWYWCRGWFGRSRSVDQSNQGDIEEGGLQIQMQRTGRTGVVQDAISGDEESGLRDLARASRRNRDPNSEGGSSYQGQSAGLVQQEGFDASILVHREHRGATSGHVAATPNGAPHNGRLRGSAADPLPPLTPLPSPALPLPALPVVVAPPSYKEATRAPPVYECNPERDAGNPGPLYGESRRGRGRTHARSRVAVRSLSEAGAGNPRRTRFSWRDRDLAAALDAYGYMWHAGM